MAAAAQFSQVTVTRYGRTETVSAAVATCLWYSGFGSQPVTVVIVRDRPGSGFGIALVTTDRAATAEQLIERYASRWSIEIAIEDAKQVFGAGQARNRTAAAVERTLPFEIACQAVAVTWYATAGHDPADLHERRALASWYASKAEPATADMAAKLRRVIIAARFRASRSDQPTPQEIALLRL
ncbi:MAG: transposase, partial [Streptosporangiaceae bacterium]